MTPGQMKDIISALVQGVPTGMTFETAESWVGNKGKLTAQVRKIFSAANPYLDLLADWQAFYRDVFGIEADFTDLVIPAKRAGFDRLLILIPGMTAQRLYDKCAQLFPSWKYTDEDLDKIVTSDRSAKNGAYAVWVRDRVEADEELKNLSANDLKQKNIPGITLEERLVYEPKFFKETGKHLDIINWTLCTGSRYGDGHVPSADWGGAGFGVGWNGPGDASDNLRSRQAVS
ncbi:MAG: hypothetical protein PHT44_03190 [Candidatus Portnoybacteria bacterium]|nr:hypothetical protein [Candidatus Portnoybacteria bacterium]MDD4982545.1 hypothetical protein [Candidatus Portnoybacteria bacterium]